MEDGELRVCTSNHLPKDQLGHSHAGPKDVNPDAVGKHLGKSFTVIP
jgi:hypothetical protein